MLMMRTVFCDDCDYAVTSLHVDNGSGDDVVLGVLAVAELLVVALC